MEMIVCTKILDGGNYTCIENENQAYFFAPLGFVYHGAGKVHVVHEYIYVAKLKLSDP